MTAKKTTSTKKPTKKATSKKVSALDAAAQVLAESGGSMTTREMIEAMAAKKLWESPAGKTPAATLYSALLREINTKGNASRFQKTQPGKFAATGATGRTEKTTEEKPEAAKPTKATKSKAKGAKKKPTAKATSSEATTTPTTPDGTLGSEGTQELVRT